MLRAQGGDSDARGMVPPRTTPCCPPSATRRSASRSAHWMPPISLLPTSASCRRHEGGLRRAAWPRLAGLYIAGQCIEGGDSNLGVFYDKGACRSAAPRFRSPTRPADRCASTPFNVIGDVFICKCERRNRPLVNAVVKRYPNVTQFGPMMRRHHWRRPSVSADYSAGEKPASAHLPLTSCLFPSASDGVSKDPRAQRPVAVLRERAQERTPQDEVWRDLRLRT